MIPTVLVDIATPPTGGLNLFNLYVTLSWSSGRSTIRLLHDFNDQLFRAAHKPELLAEDDRLEELNAKTMTWWKDMTGHENALTQIVIALTAQYSSGH